MKDFILSTTSFSEDVSTADANDHVILIAGDLTGTARTAAFAYAKEGNHIVLASENDEAAMHLTGELRARHVDATFVHADAHDELALQHLIDVTTKYYGHIDVEYLQ